MDGPTLRGGSSSADKFLRNYRLGGNLGQGSFSDVKVAEHVLTGHKVAIKILNRCSIKYQDMEENVRREIKLCKLFMHPHIIRTYEVIETPADIYFVMEYAKSGDLFDYILLKGRLKENEARKFFQQIVSGVENCHRNMVAHRDLKPENLLLDSKGNVKLADFGLSNVMRDGRFLKISCGSPAYAAPEIASGKLYTGPEIDVWSCGVILYALLCGRLPFDDENNAIVFKKIKAGIYRLPSRLSPGAMDLIQRMLVVDPTRRITIAAIRQHHWFKLHLPRYLAVPPSEATQRLKKIDEDVLEQVLRMGFDRDQLLESLQNGSQDDATVAYYLLLDNQSPITSGCPGEEFQESTEGDCTGMLYPDDGFHVAFGHGFPQEPSLRPQLPDERKWFLGLQSRAHPWDIMTKFLRAMQKLNVRWKKIGHYNIKCRWLHGFHHPEGIANNHVGPANHYFGTESAIVANDFQPQSIVTFEMQLYRTCEHSYLLDLLRVSGPHFLFLDFCDVLSKQLQAPNP